MIDPRRRAGARYPLADLDLVIWERDHRWPCPYHLYLILGDPPKAPDYPAKVIGDPGRAITSYGQRITAAASELIPISAFGLAFDSFDRILRLKPLSSYPMDPLTSIGRRLRWHHHIGMSELDFKTRVDSGFREFFVQKQERMQKAAA